MADIVDLQLCDSASIAEALDNIFPLNFNSSLRVDDAIVATIWKLSATYDSSISISVK